MFCLLNTAVFAGFNPCFDLKMTQNMSKKSSRKFLKRPWIFSIFDGMYHEYIIKKLTCTCIAMRDILTSGDLQVGHKDLGPCMLVDPIEANNNTPKTG